MPSLDRGQKARGEAMGRGVQDGAEGRGRGGGTRGREEEEG